MSRLLKLTLPEVDPKHIYINPAHIYHVCPQGAGCYIHLGPATTGHGHYVKESAEEVARMVNGDESKCTVDPEAFERMLTEFKRQFTEKQEASV